MLAEVDKGNETESSAAIVNSHETAIRSFCGNCHAVPMPESFPKSMWYEEVRRGFNFYYESGRSDLKPPSQNDVVAYFRERAPEHLTIPAPEVAAQSRIQFHPSNLSFAMSDPVAVSFVDWEDQSDTDGKLWLSDMRSGSVLRFSGLRQDSASATGLLHIDRKVVPNPAAVRRTDLDANGVVDLVVSDLGSFLPEDHQQGQLVWIPDGTAEAARTPVVLWNNIGRVADVQPIDWNSDGALDLVVAEFGWHRTGSVTLLEQVREPDETIRFQPETLDARPGAIHVVPNDVNGDGRQDVVALISQEHEQIVAYLNMPTGVEKKVLYSAPDPSWGSSGIQIVDLDRDGDLDLIYTNGDSFDSKLMKPYHGVWWLENVGDLEFTEHHVAAMPGVHRALAADFDSDGDLDLAAAAMLPQTTIEGEPVEQLHAVVWLEQTRERQFVRHVVERGRPTYAAMTVADFNRDGRPDIAVGLFEESSSDSEVVARIFWNQSREGK
ncbi:MAG: FG-GAP repeat domain-containing protein [Planctomycetota bacterium]